MKKKTSKDKLNILYIYATKEANAIWYYRVLMPRIQLGKAGHNVVISHGDNTAYLKTKEEWIDLLKNFDIVIGKHIQSDTMWDMVRYVTHELGIVLLSDFDDYLHSVDEKNPAAKAFAEGTILKTISNETIKYADGLIVATEELKKLYSKENKNIWVLPNFHEERLYPKKPVIADDAIWLYWAGSINHQSDLEMVLPAVRYILDKYPNVNFCTVMGHPKGASRYLTEEQMKDRWLRLPGVPKFTQYPTALATSPATIGICPIVDNVFNRGKSPIKFFEYTQRRIPVIASNVGPYKVIKNGVTGLLVDNTIEEWVGAIELLIENPGIRKILNANALQEVNTTYSYKDNEKLFSDTVWEIYNKLKK